MGEFDINFPEFMEGIFFVLDFYLGWLLMYIILKLIKANTRAVQIVKGVILICSLNLASQLFDLETLNMLTGAIMDWGIVAMIVVFQPEIRTGLERLGRNRAFRSTESKISHDLAHQLTQTLKDFSKEKTGALIVIEGDITLDEFIQTGTPLQSIITDELLKTIFMLKTPLHDGAVFIRNEKIWCAGAVLPVTQQEELPQTMGTRHRAALGISEISDCVVLVVSEETGKLSIAQSGKIESYEKRFEFEQALRKILN